MGDVNDHHCIRPWNTYPVGEDDEEFVEHLNKANDAYGQLTEMAKLKLKKTIKTFEALIEKYNEDADECEQGAADTDDE